MGVICLLWTFSLNTYIELKVPRPAPVSPLKPSAPKRDPVVPATADLIGKDVNCRSISNHAEEKVQVCPTSIISVFSHITIHIVMTGQPAKL